MRIGLRRKLAVAFCASPACPVDHEEDSFCFRGGDVAEALVDMVQAELDLVAKLNQEGGYVEGWEDATREE